MKKSRNCNRRSPGRSLPGGVDTLSDALGAIARRAITDVEGTAGAAGEDALRGLREFDPAQAHQPASDLYERLRFAEHALARQHPALAGRLRQLGEDVERLLG